MGRCSVSVVENLDCKDEQSVNPCIEEPTELSAAELCVSKPNGGPDCGRGWPPEGQAE